MFSVFLLVELEFMDRLTMLHHVWRIFLG